MAATVTAFSFNEYTANNSKLESDSKKILNGSVFWFLQVWSRCQSNQVPGNLRAATKRTLPMPARGLTPIPVLLEAFEEMFAICLFDTLTAQTADAPGVTPSPMAKAQGSLLP